MSGLQKKQINKILRDRINWWAFSFNKPEHFEGILSLTTPQNTIEEGLNEADKLLIANFQQQVIDSTIVTGGSIASMLLGEEVNDIDVYFTDREVARKVATYYLNTMRKDGNLTVSSQVHKIAVVDNNSNGVDIMIRSAGVVGDGIDIKDYDYFESQDQNKIDDYFAEYVKRGETRKIEGQPLKHIVSFITSNAITLQNNIQIILRFCGDVEEIHKNFDFAHCTNYWTQETGVVYNVNALQHLLERRLVYIGSRFPIATMFRLRKFIERGYRVSGGEMVKIAYDISKIDMNDVRVLKDQLMGMDLAYFGEVISILRNGEKEGGKELDRTYLFQVLNQVFQEGTHD